MSSSDTTPPEAGPTTKEELVALGWTEEQADFLSKFDAACQGQDASLVIPVTIHALENVARILTPDAQRAAAALFSEAAMRMGQAAANTEQQLQALEKLANEQGDQDGASNPDADHPPGPTTVQ